MNLAFENYGMWHGADSELPRTRYIVRQDGSHWTAEMLCEEKLTLTRGGFRSKRAAMQECQALERSHAEAAA